MNLEEITITATPAQGLTKGTVSAKTDNELIESIVQRLEALEKTAPVKDGQKEDAAPEKVAGGPDVDALANRNRRVLDMLGSF